MPKDDKSQINNPLTSYLRSNKAVDQFSHTSIGTPKGSYYIKDSELEDLYKVYNDVVFKKNITTYLTEGIKDREFTPLKIDIDLRYFKATKERIYTDTDIDQICMLYMKKLEEYLDEPDENERLFFILEKPSPTFDKDKQGNKKTNKDGLFRVKDGFHIMAPEIVTNEYLQLLARDTVYKNCGSILDKHGFDNTYADIFDRAVIDRNNWQMYGSTKPGQPPYLVKRVIRVFGDRVEQVEYNYTTEKLVRLLSVRNKWDQSMIQISKEAEVYNPENNKSKKRTISKTSKKNKQTRLGKKEKQLVTKYVECLSAERATNFHTWIQVGWCLYNLHNKDDSFLKVWIAFSKKANGYANTCELDCAEKWDEMHNEGLGMGSLKMWAKEDNPEMYRKVMSTDIWTHINRACKSGKGNSYDVANVLYTMYKDAHICVSIKDSVWFYYDKSLHRWIRDDKGITLKRKISTELYTEFSKLNISEQQQSLESDDQHAQNAAKISKVMLRLKYTAFKSNLMTECGELFYDRDRNFLEKLDSHNNLIGCVNGVYDLVREEFRDGRPEDYISKTTKINYIPFDSTHEEIKEIMKFYKGLFVIKNIRDYVLTKTASFLSGSTSTETFDIYSGKGGNGKSKHIELLESVMGDYAVKLPIQLLTAKRAASNSATPELARTKGVRLVTMQEPDTKTKINVGLMKEMTGGDKIQCRALYAEPFEFKPQFKMVLCCNDKPELPPHDEGTWRRVKNTEFISKFTYDIEPDIVLDFKINTELAERFEDWSEPFLSILIEYHKRYRREGIREPDEINEYTAEYRAESNHFRDFINDRIEYDPLHKKGMSIDRMYETYRAWYRGVNADEKPKKRKELQNYLDDKYGRYFSPGVSSKQKGYKGLKIKIMNTDFADDVECIIDELGE